MIKTEAIIVRESEYIRTYSDTGYYIERDRVIYEEAVDPLGSGRVYTETTELIDSDEYATEEDYQAALERLGVELNGEED